MSNKDIILEEKEGQTEFDVILFGTGIVESILACGLSRAGKKILHVDANRFYGGNFASLNLKQYKSYIEGKLDELPSFRSNGTADDQGPITMEEVQRIVGEGEEVDFEPVTFLNSLTSPQNVFGNFNQTDHITEYKSSFNAFERETLRKRYRIKYRIGYTFSMKDKNGLMVYRITKILTAYDVYECQRVFVTKNHNDFPMVIYLDLDQISHTKTYIPTPLRNMRIFKWNNVLYRQCLSPSENPDESNCDSSEPTEPNESKLSNPSNEVNESNESTKSNDPTPTAPTTITSKSDKISDEISDENCICRSLDDTESKVMFYDIENEADSIIGTSFEYKNILYEIKDIDSHFNILCTIATSSRIYSSSHTQKDEVIITFPMDQISEFQWLKPRKYLSRSRSSPIPKDVDEDWGDIEYHDTSQWSTYLHLRSTFDLYENGYRKVCIDFIPNLVYAVESFVEVLVRSKVSTYVDFRGIDKNFVYGNNMTVNKVPLSRSDVFTTKSLSFLEKRQLTKFMQSVLTDTVHSVGSNGGGSNGGVSDELNQMTFSAFMTSQQVSSKLESFIKYALAFMDCPQEDPPASAVIHRLRLFLKSIGRFSAGSFLYPLYGCGDLAPGYVRSSAVKGGIFILDWNPRAIVMQQMEYHNVPCRRGFVYCDSSSSECNFYVLLSVKESLNLLNGRTEIMQCTGDMPALIGRRFKMSSYCYEVHRIRVLRDNDGEISEVVVRCLLSPQIPLDPMMHDVPKCVYLEIHQLLHVQWVDMVRTENTVDADHQLNDSNDLNDDQINETVRRCTGVITKSNQFIRTKYVVGAADYFTDSIDSVSVKHIRMTVISDGPIAGTIKSANGTSTDNDGDSDDSDSSDSDEDNDGDETQEKQVKPEKSQKDQNQQSQQTQTRKKESKSDCAVVHIPPHTVPFDNAYSIHIIQLDHYSCTVPHPLCLTFFWMQCGEDTEDALRAMDRCFDLFYRTTVIIGDKEDGDTQSQQKPLGLMKTVYEQRVRTVDTQRFPENVFVVEDLNDTIGFENAVQSAKILFKNMFPNDPWMEKDKPKKPQQTRADKVFSALEESKQNESNDTVETVKEQEEVAKDESLTEESAKGSTAAE